MPIRKVVKKSTAPPDTAPGQTGGYSNSFARPEAYKPIQAAAPPPTPSPFAVVGIPASSTRDLNYFFNLAGSLYRESGGGQDQASTSAATASADAPPSYGDDFQDTQMDLAAVMVIWLFRLTATHVLPVTERFHLGPADRQPLYSLTAQPSIRSAQEFNELLIQRRDPIRGVRSPNLHSLHLRCSKSDLTYPRYGIQFVPLTSSPLSTLSNPGTGLYPA